MNLSISDFRSIVGEHSLGYVDVKTDKSGEAVGLTKISNHKTLKFLNISEAKVDRMLGGQKALDLRAAFADTIRATFGNQIAADRLEEILGGLLNDGDQSNSKPLARREVRQIFSTLDDAVAASRFNIENAARARAGSTASRLRTICNTAERANLEGYVDGIITSANVRQLHSQVRAALPNASAKTVEKVTTDLMAHFAEVALRQAAKGRTPDSFADFMATYASNDLIPYYDFTLTSAQLGEAKTLAKTWLADTLKHDETHRGFHNKTDVHGLGLREYKLGSVSINGQPVPATCSKEPLVDGGVEIVRDDLSSGGGTGVSGATSEEKCAFHETLIRTFQDRKTRRLVSQLLSMANGAKGFYADMFDLTKNVKLLGNVPKWVGLMMALNGKKAGFSAKQLNNDSEAKGFYKITVEPDSGKVKIDMISAEGVAVVAGKVEDLSLEGENKQDFTLTVSRQKYHTVITVDPSVRDGNGYPDFTVDTMEMVD